MRVVPIKVRCGQQMITTVGGANHHKVQQLCTVITREHHAVLVVMQLSRVIFTLGLL
jgi:hypothetical protein